jgi:hypothetical protein
MTWESFTFSRWNLNVHRQFIPCGGSQFIHCGGRMPKHKTSALDDNILRAFYKFCGLTAPTIEAAIKKRYEQPTNFIGREKACAAARAAHPRKRNLIEDAEGK